VPFSGIMKMVRRIPAVKPNSKIKMVWDFIKLIIIIVNFFVISVSINFDQNYQSILFNTDQTLETYVLWIWVVFSFFSFDIALKFNTGIFYFRIINV
jgi:hypothetical protein